MAISRMTDLFYSTMEWKDHLYRSINQFVLLYTKFLFLKLISQDGLHAHVCSRTLDYFNFLN